MPTRAGDLEIDQDPDFQRRAWRAQEAGFVLLVLFLVAALLGLLGPGLLSDGAAREGALQAEYLRYPRYLMPHTLELEVPPDGRRDARVWIEREYLDWVYVQSITPEPDSVEADDRRVVYTFARAVTGRPLVVTWSLRSHRVGVPTVRLGVEGGAGLRFRQVFYP